MVRWPSAVKEDVTDSGLTPLGMATRRLNSLEMKPCWSVRSSCFPAITQKHLIWYHHIQVDNNDRNVPWTTMSLSVVLTVISLGWKWETSTTTWDETITINRYVILLFNWITMKSLLSPEKLCHPPGHWRASCPIRGPYDVPFDVSDVPLQRRGNAYQLARKPHQKGSRQLHRTFQMATWT